MTNRKLAETICDSLSDGYDDEENRVETIEKLEAELDFTSYYIIDVIQRMVEKINDLEE